MATLAKRKRRNRTLSPWNNRLMTPWSNDLLLPLGDRFFASNFLDNSFKNEFFEEDTLIPAMNVKEHKKDFEIEYAAPGFDKKDFEVTIENDVLNVTAKKEQNEEQEEEDFSSREFSYKSFKRSSTLPDSVDLDQNIKASYKNGILKIKLLKREDIQEEKPSKKVIEIS